MTTNQPVFKRLASWLTMGACAALLAACGGGGGSPGATGGNGGTVQSKAASVDLTASGTSILVGGDSVTLTAVVKDSSNGALSGEKVTFKSSDGSVAAQSATSDASGVVTAKLSLSTAPGSGVVTLTASAGNATSKVVTLTVNAAKPTVIIMTDSPSDTLQSAGILKITVVAKAGDNTTLPAGVDVALTASGGELAYATRKTDANGMVTATLTTANQADASIVLTASVAGATPVTKTITVIKATSTLLLTTSNGTLDSSGAAGKEVSVIALVKNASNAVVKGATVTFSSDSGSLSSSSAVTDDKGRATVLLSTGTDPTSRVISVTATSPGTSTAKVQVTVSGTAVSINSSSTVNINTTSEINAVVTDSSGAPLAGRDVTFGAANNTLTVKNGGLARTDNIGRVILVYNAKVGGQDSIFVRSLGVSATKNITVNTANFVVSVVDDLVNRNIVSSGLINTCYAVVVHNDVAGVPQTGGVTVSSSRGAVYSDAACTSALTSAVPLDAGGNTNAYVKATGPGVATVTATSGVTGTSVQTTVEIVAPLTTTSVITVQADPSVVGANAAGSPTLNQTTLRAVVTDKLNQGNLVKGAKVAFSIITDPSGGYLSQPSEVFTNEAGVATVSYVAGASATALDGVRIQAQIIGGVSAASSTVNLTVAQKSLFISAGTGATVLTPSSSTYQIDYSVFVTDAAGNAVPGVTVTGSVKPRGYRKGSMTFIGIDGPWQPAILVAGQPTAGYSAICANEDLDSDGVLSAGEDVNGNGRLDPLIPITITSSGKTDSNGIAVLSMVYPRDRAYWVDVDFVIRGTVSGSEARYVGYALLPGIGTDYGNKAVAPPGRYSPYGVSTNCTDTL